VVAISHLDDREGYEISQNWPLFQAAWPLAEGVCGNGIWHVDFDRGHLVEVDELGATHGRLVRRVAVPRPLLEADVVIACPKLKTHFLDPITGAIKLWVGAVRPDTMHRLHRDAVEETVADLLTVTRCARANRSRWHTVGAGEDIARADAAGGLELALRGARHRR